MIADSLKKIQPDWSIAKKSILNLYCQLNQIIKTKGVIRLTYPYSVTRNERIYPYSVT